MYCTIVVSEYIKANIAREAKMKLQFEFKSNNISNQTGLASNLIRLLAYFLSISKYQSFRNLLISILEKLTRLLELIFEQWKKFDYWLDFESNIYNYHQIMKHYLSIQNKRTFNQIWPKLIVFCFWFINLLFKKLIDGSSYEW